MTWWKAIKRIMSVWRTANWMKTQDWPKPRCQVLTWKEYCKNGMSHER